MIPLAVTGMGIVSPLGIGREAWQTALATKDAPSVFTDKSKILSATQISHACVAELQEFSPQDLLGDKGLRNLDRLTKLLIVAARLALVDAGIKREGQFVALSSQQVGLCSSTAYGSLEAITELKLVAELEDPRYLNPARFPNTVINAAAGYVSIWEDLRAPNVTLVNGNCGALDAVLSAETHLHRRRGDAFLIGGGEALSDALYLAFEMLGVIASADQPCSPGLDQSQGMRLGEGAAYLCIERDHEAHARGAHVHGRVLGYGTAFEVPQSEAEIVHFSSVAIERAICAALEDAGLKPSDIDLVCTSMSGIAAMDQAEFDALSHVFGNQPWVLAPKQRWGETLGASGAFGMAAALSWLSGTPLSTPIREGSTTRLRHAVVTAVGYYGNVSAVVLQGEGA
jgi:3-oxoacyl-[acyl-carrier-protein] synthase II